MHSGQFIFSQIMGYFPMYTFRRCVARYQGNHKVKTFTCRDQYFCMAFAQLTYRESLRVFDQQFLTVGADHCHALPSSLEGGAVLQMDQATPAHQILFRHNGKRSQDSGLDRRVRLCVGRHYQKTTQFECQSLHNSTNYKHHPLRTNAVKSSAYRSGYHDRGLRHA